MHRALTVLAIAVSLLAFVPQQVQAAVPSQQVQAAVPLEANCASLSFKEDGQRGVSGLYNGSELTLELHYEGTRVKVDLYASAPFEWDGRKSELDPGSTQISFSKINTVYFNCCASAYSKSAIINI